MRWLFLLALVLACLAIPAQALDKFATCLDKASNSDKQSLDLARECPELFRDFQQQKLLSTLEPKSARHYTLQQLMFLRNSQSPLQQAFRVEHAQLDPLLANLLTAGQENQQWPWWRTFLDWLDEFKAGDYQQEYQWLRRFLATIKPSEQTLHYFFYGMIAVLVLASAWLLTREIQLAGGLSPLRFKRQPQHPVPIAASGQEATNRPPIDQSAKQQMAEMLAQTLDKIAERCSLPIDSSLSYRQILALLDRQQTVPGLNRLLLTTEPILFGSRPASPETLAAYQRETQALLESLT